MKGFGTAPNFPNLINSRFLLGLDNILVWLGRTSARLERESSWRHRRLWLRAAFEIQLATALRGTL